MIFYDYHKDSNLFFKEYEDVKEPFKQYDEITFFILIYFNFFK
jgi:hypothetical protein